jgi:Flp pilus assembly protein TadD
MVLRVAWLALVAVVVAWTYAPAREFAFLNWDDDAVIVRNASLDGPGAMRWAFTTTYMEHYQPLSWLMWAAIKRGAGATPQAFHTANLISHVVCALLVFALTIAVLRRTVADLSAVQIDLVALAAALLWAAHPLRVEVVAWVSAFPYAVSLALTILAALAWLRLPTTVPDGGSGRGFSPTVAPWWLAAFLLFLLSLLARPIALGLPIVLVALDVGLFRRSLWSSVTRVWPFAAVAAIAAGVEALARAPGITDTPGLYRLQSAASAPFVYLWHTVAPAARTPLDVLPASPTAQPLVIAVALAAIGAIIVAAWHWRDQRPRTVAAVVAYVALLAPATGLVSSGLQATADRYTYVPGVAIAIAVAAAAAHWTGKNARARWVIAAAAVAAIAASIVVTRQTLEPWRDSGALWTRVVELDPANDVGLYNLGTALAAAGRPEEAAARYRNALALQPAHAAARANLDLIEAARFEREGNDAASRGNLATAADRYARAVERDPKRTHAQAGLGMALVSLGRTRDAIPSLTAAIQQGDNDPAIANALALSLAESGNPREGRAVLERALSVHQTNVELGANLARLLVTTPEFARDDAPLALRLATAIADATGRRDPRALDTLAAALAINGRLSEAAETSVRAAALAEAQGDREMAVQITARGRAYRARGR